MDDKLYYVEGPEGQVLGPMNMIHILEGIAAGAIGDDARICEVGSQEWIELADVAHTRQDDDDVLAAAAAIEAQPEPVVDHTPLEDPAIAGETPETVTRETEPVTESLAEASEDDSLDLMPSMPMADTEPASPAGSAPVVDETPVADHDPWAPAKEAPAEPVGASGAEFLSEPVADAEPFAAPVEESAAAEIPHDDLPASARPYDPDELPASSRSYDAEELPESARPYEGEELPASAMPYEEATAGADDFALQMPGDDEPDAYGEPESEAPRKSRAWVAPVVVLATLPVIAGVYLLTGGTIPIVNYKLDLGGDESVATAELTPVEAAWRKLRSADPAAAIPAFDAIIEAEPENASAHHGKGLAQLALGNTASAAKSLQQAAGLAPEDTDVLVDLGRARAAMDDFAGALEAANAVLEAEPAHKAAQRLAGVSHFGQGNWSDAVQRLTPFVADHPADIEARHLLAQAMASDGRLEAAVAEIDGYLAAAPEDFDAQRERMDWMNRLGQQAEARKLYATFAADRPESAPAQLLAGLAHGRSEEAADHFRRALELDPSLTEARTQLDATLAVLQPKKPAPKPRATKPAVTPQPDRSALMARVGEIRSALHRESFSTARTAIQSARQEFSGDAVARRNLDLWDAICTFQEGDLSGALQRFEKLNPTASYAASGYGKGAVENWIAAVHVSGGNARAAVAVLDAVGPESPDQYAIARVWEGVALASLGMDDLAQRMWARVSTDVGSRVSNDGRAAVKTAEFLAGALSEKDYRGAVSSAADWENDMYYFLGFQARRANDVQGAQDAFRRSLELSRGQEFPYHLSRAEMEGAGLTGTW